MDRTETPDFDCSYKAPLKLLAESKDIPVLHVPEDKGDFSHWVPPAPFSKPSVNNVLVTASFGRRIPSSCLDLFGRGRKLNVHPSLLPRYRGAAPIQHALLDAVDTTGVSVIEMEDGRGFDFGDIWAQQAMSFAAVPQDHSKATKARLIRTEQSEIDWKTWDAECVERTHRAIGHQRPVFTTIPDKHKSRLQLLEMRVARNDDRNLRLQLPGDALYEPTDNTLRIRCAGGSQLIVSSLKTENKNALKVKEWWNGIPSIWLDHGMLKLGSIE